MLRRLLVAIGAGAIIALALVVAIERIEMSEKADAGRALLARHTQLTLQALAPGSALACLDRQVGGEVDKACEMAVFESPQAVAAATTYVAARLAVLRAAFARAEGGRSDVLDELTAERRGLARDRFGFVAHVLARDYGCTARECSALAMFDDADRLKGDLEQQPLQAFITRHAVTWAMPPQGTPVAAATKEPAVAVAGPAATPPAAPQPTGGLANVAAVPAQPLTLGHPVDPRWKFPSADSIPAVSIMTPEPKLPASEAAPASQPQQEAKMPLPPKRPQAEAAPPAQAR
jgi:hypothetical protein